MRKVISGLCLLTLFFAPPLSAWSVGEDDPLWKHETFGKKVYQVGHRLMDANGIKEHVGFTASASRVNNAHADDFENQVTVERGILGLCESDDELAAVLAHELAHITQNHGRDMRQIHRVEKGASAGLVTYGALLSLATLNPLPFFAAKALPKAPTKVINSKVSRDQETEADELGVTYMVRAGYNPWAMEKILYKIAGDGTHFEFLRDHPRASLRVSHIHSFIAAQYPQFGPGPDSEPAQVLVQSPISMLMVTQVNLKDEPVDGAPGGEKPETVELTENQQHIVTLLSQNGYLNREQLMAQIPQLGLLEFAQALDGLVQKKWIRTAGKAPKEIYLLTDEASQNLKQASPAAAEHVTER